MKILFDTNVVLDLLLDRKPFSLAAAHLFSEVERGNIEGYICATTVTTVHYLATKVIGPRKAQQEIHRLLTLLEVAPVNRLVLEASLDDRFSDFEDAVLHQAARHMGTDGIVTRNLHDFKEAKMTIYSPEELIKALENE